MTTKDGFRRKKALSDSRFAVLYEDPSYEDWDNAQEDWREEDEPSPNLNGLLQEKLGTDPYSPFVTINS